jgi:hypothetical protein
MKNIIFLDLDGPMIPWWGIDCKDETGKNGRILDGFHFFSTFHPDAIAALRKITEETNSVIVTNSTHNGGLNNSKYEYPGASHIRNIFEANGVGDLLIKITDLDKTPHKLYDTNSLIASGFKNPAYLEANRNRVRGVKSWLARWAPCMDKVPAFIAIDDDSDDFDDWNTVTPKEEKIKLLWVGNYLNDGLADMAIKMLREDPNYVAKK